METDVIVAGSGAAGLAAALTASELGLQVELLEKADSVGGGTAYSYGILWAGNNHLQNPAEAAGDLHDAVEYMLRLGGGHHDEARLCTLATESGRALAFFARCGLQLEVIEGLADMYAGKIATASTKAGRSLEPKPISAAVLGDWAGRALVPAAIPYRARVGEFRRWGGIHNQANWDSQLVAERAAADVRCMGAALVVGLLEQVLRRGISVQLENGVKRLLVEDGAVVGVETSAGKHMRARRGVVLATGGYESNIDLVKSLDWLPGYDSMFPASRDGDGLIMSVEIGARLCAVQPNVRAHLGYRIPGRSPDQPGPFRLASIIELASPHTLVVNRSGRRFANEARFAEAAAQIRRYDEATHQHPNLPGFLIFDEQYARSYTFADNPPGAPIPGWVARGPTVEGLARALDIDPLNLAATVERFNGFARGGIDEDFGRGGDIWRQTGGGEAAVLNSALGSIERPPFYGVRLSPTYSSSVGIECDIHARALHQRGYPIPGLYVAGNAAAPTEIGVGYQAGTSLSSALTYGYLAVRHMAAMENGSPPGK
ncbi:MAG: FAD-dependent oxidoreductase [Reyranellaceae bacterium]